MAKLEQIDLIDIAARRQVAFELGYKELFILGLIWRWNKVKKSCNMTRLVQVWVCFIWSYLHWEGKEVIPGYFLHLQGNLGQWPGNVWDFQTNSNRMHGETQEVTKSDLWQKLSGFFWMGVSTFGLSHSLVSHHLFGGRGREQGWQGAGFLIGCEHMWKIPFIAPSLLGGGGGGGREGGQRSRVINWMWINLLLIPFTICIPEYRNFVIVIRIL